MQNKSDILIDVSVRLTEWWVEHKSNGSNDFYSNFNDLFNAEKPATIKDMINYYHANGIQNGYFAFNSLSEGLYETLKEDGVL